MSRATVQHRQTLTDIAVQYLGSAEGTFALAWLNGLELTQELTAGQVLDLPAPRNKRAARVLQEGGYYPAADAASLDLSIDMVLQRVPLLPNSSDPRAEVLPNQTLTDIAIQHLGSAQRVYELSDLNGLTVTAELTPGDLLRLPEIGRSDVAAFFRRSESFPASGAELLEGIDYWMVEYEFEVQ